MTDREKVIEGLKNCTNECCATGETCPYYLNYDGDIDNECEVRLHKDALALLKAQEPRVMTLEEIEDWDGAVFFEACETDMYYALIETVEPTAGMDGAFVFINVVPGEYHRRVWGGENYGSIWRCWTSRPTDEQREATPWE